MCQRGSVQFDTRRAETCSARLQPLLISTFPHPRFTGTTQTKSTRKATSCQGYLGPLKVKGAAEFWTDDASKYWANDAVVPCVIPLTTFAESP